MYINWNWDCSIYSCAGGCDNSVTHRIRQTNGKRGRESRRANFLRSFGIMTFVGVGRSASQMCVGVSAFIIQTPSDLDSGPRRATISRLAMQNHGNPLLFLVSSRETARDLSRNRDEKTSRWWFPDWSRPQVYVRKATCLRHEI